MGKFLGIPKHYSKVAAMLLWTGMILSLLQWVPDKYIKWNSGVNNDDLASFGYILLAMYMLICAVFAFLSEQWPFFKISLVIGITMIALAIWRVYRFYSDN